MGPTSAVLAPVQLSSRSVGVIRELSFSVNNLLASSQVTFVLRINGAPVDGYTFAVFPFNTPHITISALEKGDREYVEAPTNASIDVAVTVADGGSYLVGVNYAGWSYPEDLRTYGQAR